jgi:hypothetical protein
MNHPRGVLVFAFIRVYSRFNPSYPWFRMSTPGSQFAHPTRGSFRILQLMAKAKPEGWAAPIPP